MPRQFVCIFCHPPEKTTQAGHLFFQYHLENSAFLTSAGTFEVSFARIPVYRFPTLTSSAGPDSLRPPAGL
jgi:hypothetical protein